MTLTHKYANSAGVLFAAIVSLFSISVEQTAIAVNPELEPNGGTPERCPTVAVECPSSFSYDKPLSFKVTFDGPVDPKIRYDWAISTGKILNGQGTRTLTVDMSGMGNQGITATVTVQGLAKECGAQASCSIIQLPPPPAVLFDRYYPNSDYSARRPRQKKNAQRRN